MPDWSWLFGNLLFDTIGEDGADSGGTGLTVTVANTKGGYVQLVASSPFSAVGIRISARITNSVGDCLLDIAVGAAASEQVIVPDILVTGRSSHIQHIFIPIAIPAGSRIAARFQSTSTIVTMDVIVNLVSAPFMPSAPLGLVNAYGENTGDSGGVGIDPGGIANTKGGYSQIEATTSSDTRCLLIRLGNQGNTIMANGEFLLDIAVGAAASEQIIIPDLWFRASTAEILDPSNFGPFLVNIPAGTRLAARAQSTIIDATDRLFDVVLYGVD